MIRLEKISFGRLRVFSSGVVLLSACIIYSYSIAATVNLRSSCDALQQQLDSAKDAPVKMAAILEELKNDEQLCDNTDSAGSAHERLLGIVADYCQGNDLMLRDFSSPVIYSADEWIVETHPFTVEGNFTGLIKLIRQLEKERTCRVVSADFHSKKDNKTKTTSLLLTLYVQDMIRHT